MISGTHPLDQEVSMAFSTPVGGAILQTLGAIGPAHAAVFLHCVGHFLSARPHAVSIQSGRSQMALGGRGGCSGRGWLCLLGWTPALLLFNTQTQHHQLQFSSSSAVTWHTNSTPSATTQFQLCCYSTHKSNSISGSRLHPRPVLYNTQTQLCQLQLNSRVQEADRIPGLCYTAHKANIVCYNSIPGSRQHPRPVLYSTQSQHCLLQLNSRKQTASQACVIQHTKPTLSATTQFQEADSTPGLCYTAHKANTVCYNSIPGIRQHPRPVLYSTQSQHCLLQLNSRKQTALQDCVIQHTKPTLSATTQFCCNSIPGSRLHPRLVLYSTQSHHCLL